MSKESNIKVAVRARPMTAREETDGCAIVIAVDGPTATMYPNTPQKKTFTYDHVYDWTASQEQVYSDLGQPLVAQALNGYNGTIFAYGQTGSGKTYTMMGTPDNPGIIPMLNNDLFAALDEGPEDRQFLVVVSYLEIYNEVIRDLLNPGGKALKIREHPKTGVYVENLASLVVHSSKQMADLLEQGNAIRQVAATSMNEQSSRSHSCFIIHVDQKQTERSAEREKITSIFANINLVDLAGSERVAKTGATGERLKEGAAINKSLSALANVINALSKQDATLHIPYRDSKLTRLLQQSLGGNALTCMIAAVSPADFNGDETLSTLLYASRAKTIKNQMRRNENVQERMIRELREEIAKLRQELAATKTGLPAGVPMDEHTAMKMKQMQEMIANLEQAQQDTWEEKERLSKMYEEERERHLEKIRSVMSGLHAENLELLRRVHSLQVERNQLTKQYKRLRQEYAVLKDALQNDVQQLEKASDAPADRKLVERLNGSIKARREQLMQLRDQLTEVKAALERNDAAQAHERAAAATHKRILDEDAELRQAIQEDERAKLEKQRASLLSSALQEEKVRLREETERIRVQLSEILSKRGETPTEREQQLAAQLVQAHQQHQMLRMEMEERLAEAEADRRYLLLQFKRAMKAQKREQVDTFRAALTTFEDERRRMHAKLEKTTECLRQASSDIAYLKARNAELEGQASRK